MSVTETIDVKVIFLFALCEHMAHSSHSATHMVSNDTIYQNYNDRSPEQEFNNPMTQTDQESIGISAVSCVLQ